MESGNANIFQLTFTTEKAHFKQTNILSIKRHQDYKIVNRRDHACIFERFLSRVNLFTKVETKQY